MDFSLPLNRNKHYINRYANLFNEFIGNKYKTLPDLYLPVSGEKIFHFNNNNLTIGFYPGGKHKGHRSYPHEHTIRLIKLLTQQQYNIVMLGEKRESEEHSDEIKTSKCQNIISLAGKTNIEEFFNAIRQVDLLITIDSAAMHIAAALKTPFIALLGLSTSPTSTIIPKVSFGKILKIENNLIREEDYIRNITPEIVLQAVEDMIQKGFLEKSSNS